MKHELPTKNSRGEVCRFSAVDDPKCIAKLFSSHKPFIIRNASTSWNAISTWNADYLSELVGTNQVWIRDSHQHSSQIERVAFSEFLSRLQKNTKTKKPYLVLSRMLAHRRARSVQLSRLLKDIEIPCYIPWERLWEINLWMGYGSNKSHLHFDPEENLLIPINGAKELIIFEPKYTKYIYQNLDKGGNILQSKVDIFNLDYKKFSKIKNVKYYQIKVEPGDALYIPSGWWHAVESAKGINISVNIWWLPSPKFLFKFPTCSRLWQKHSKWWSVLFPK